jgi:hypothetical protein
MPFRASISMPPARAGRRPAGLIRCPNRQAVVRSIPAAGRPDENGRPGGGEKRGEKRKGNVVRIRGEVGKHVHCCAVCF